MTTIKERAIEKYCTHCGARTEYNCSATDTPCYDIKTYIKIAKEQKAIDDDHLRDVKKKVIDKAIEYWDKRFRELKQEIREGYDISRPKELIDFRKAMGE